MNPFGPIFKFELVRVARKQRLILGRCMYIALLLITVAVMYLMLFPRGPDSLSDFLFRSIADRRVLAQFAFAFFVVFALMQFAIGAFATASVAAVPLAEEKERKTLEYLLTTPLTDREIVLGKLAARVAQVMITLLAGLPVLAIMQFMGGVDPALLAAAFGGTLMIMLSAAGVAAAVSVRAPNVRIASGRTLGIVALYLIFVPSITAWLVRFAHIPPILGWHWYADFADWLNAGNPFSVAIQLGRTLSAAGRIDTLLPTLFLKYAIFHAAVALLTGGWAALRLRKIIARQNDVASKTVAKKIKREEAKGRKRRDVFQTMPVLWRETCTQVAKVNEKWYVRWAKAIGYLISFMPLVGAVIEAHQSTFWRYEDLHLLVRITGTAAMVISLLQIGSLAGSSMDRERRKKTFDELALTDMTNREILLQKGLAAVWSVRWFWLWIAVHWLADLLFGGMSLLAPFIVVPLYLFFAAVAMMIGLYFAVHASPQVRPGGTAMLVLIFLGLAPWIIPASAAILADNNLLQEQCAYFALGASPPTAIGMLTLAPNYMDFVTTHSRMMPLFLVGLMCGVLATGLLIGSAWRRAMARLTKDRRE